MRKTKLTILSLMVSIGAFAQPGLLDTDFANGQVFADINFLEGLEISTESVVDDQDRIWLSGITLAGEDYQIFLSRLSPDGEYDSDLDENGWRVINLSPGSFESVASMTYRDNKLILCGNIFSVGQLRQYLFRVNEDGQNDGSFGFLGIAAFPIAAVVRDMVMDEDGNFYLAGTLDGDIVVTKVLPDGVLDLEFGENGICTLGGNGIDNAAAVDLDDDGNIYVFGILELNDGSTVASAYSCTSTGIVNSSFSPTGRRTFSSIGNNNFQIHDGIISDSGDQAFMVGYIQTDDDDMVIVSFDLEGEPVPSFGQNGIVQYDMTQGGIEVGRAIAETEEGIIIAAEVSVDGAPSNTGLAYFNFNGDLIEDFVDSGASIYLVDAEEQETPYSVGLQSDGNIIVTGTKGGEISLSGFAFRVLMSGDPNGLDERDFEKLTVYPNPAREHIRVHASSFAYGPQAYEIFSMNGSKVQSGILLSADGVIDVSRLKSGLYQLVVGSRALGRFIRE